MPIFLEEYFLLNKVSSKRLILTILTIGLVILVNSKQPQLSERDLWGDRWVLYHPREGMGRTNLRDFTVERSQMIVPLFTYKNGG